MQQPLRDLDQVRTFMSGMGPRRSSICRGSPGCLTRLVSVPPLIGFVALLGTAAIIAMAMLDRTDLARRGQAAIEMNA